MDSSFRDTRTFGRPGRSHVTTSEQILADKFATLDANIAELQRKVDADSVLLTQLDDSFKKIRTDIQAVKERISRLEMENTTDPEKRRLPRRAVSTDECPICREAFQDPHETPCGHVFCRECICQWLMRTKSCPFDRKRLTVLDVMPVSLPVQVDSQSQADVSQSTAACNSREWKPGESRELTQVCEQRNEEASLPTLMLLMSAIFSSVGVRTLGVP
ncbi:hypothetical protein AC578_2568 [Pseudocercospora eumusae]|uniref:RING-type domain-containing protein n=1 Tax=Pseudocercospora eumusae TaxID=321146 RepID=A0A139HHS4_9PEZI|nr:hypothetical protein AC578_2568 [Pseudocercospora eumusae]